jgi:hypothetical protein
VSSLSRSSGEVRSAADIVTVISDDVSPRKAGTTGLGRYILIEGE